MEIVAVNYADEKFRKAQKLNSKTALKKGRVNRVIEYSPESIDEKFASQHSEILTSIRGGILPLEALYH